MRQGWLWVMSLAAVVSGAACDDASARGADQSDIMVLEVGGSQPSLREALVAQGISVRPGHQLSAPSESGFVDLEGAGCEQQGNVGGPSEDGDDVRSTGELSQEPEVSPDRVLPQESEWVIVTLREQETLTHVARRCLGDGGRFYEIMKWNGFSERDTRRMAVGAAIKIKRSEMR